MRWIDVAAAEPPGLIGGLTRAFTDQQRLDLVTRLGYLK